MKNLLETSLTPENDLQDLWELSGRVKAVLAWIESNPYIDKDILAAMLGGQVQAAGYVEQQKEKGTGSGRETEEAF